jgi:hypothetical protein
MKVILQDVPCKTKYCDENVDLIAQEYANGRVALQIYGSRTREPILTATVNLPDTPCRHDEVFIKDYSENEGVLAWIIKAKVIRPAPTGVFTSDYAVVSRHILTNSILEKLQ